MKMDAERTFINAVAGEMAAGVCEAVGLWMADVDATLADDSINAQDKLARIQSIVAAHKAAAEKRDLPQRHVERGWARGASVSHAI